MLFDFFTANKSKRNQKSSSSSSKRGDDDDGVYSFFHEGFLKITLSRQSYSDCWQCASRAIICNPIAVNSMG